SGEAHISAERSLEFAGLYNFVLQLQKEGRSPIILKGAAESGARNQKVYMLYATEGRRVDQLGAEAKQAFFDAAQEIIRIMHDNTQDVVTQKVICINPEYWAKENIMEGFTDDKLVQRTQPVQRTKYPRTPYFSSFRVVPSSSDPSKPYDKTSPLVVINNQIATNVGRGGILNPLLAEWIQENHREDLMQILNDNADKVMKALNEFAPKFAERFEKIFGRKIGRDLLGNSYGWLPFSLVDFLAEPVFEEAGEILPAEPVYKNGKRVGSKIMLKREDGSKFEGKVVGWRVYLVEPNTGIGQIDRRTLSMEELVVKAAERLMRVSLKATPWRRIPTLSEAERGEDKWQERLTARQPEDRKELTEFLKEELEASDKDQLILAVVAADEFIGDAALYNIDKSVLEDDEAISEICARVSEINVNELDALVMIRDDLLIQKEVPFAKDLVMPNLLLSKDDKDADIVDILLYGFLDRNITISGMADITISVSDVDGNDKEVFTFADGEIYTAPTAALLAHITKIQDESKDVLITVEDVDLVNFSIIEESDRVILRNWAQTARAYGRKLEGDDFFRPSPEATPNPDVPRAPISADDYIASRPDELNEQVQEELSTMERALKNAREALGLSADEKFDEISLSVLIKYYVIEELSSVFDVDDIRRGVMERGIKGNGQFDKLQTGIAYSLISERLYGALEQIAGKDLDVSDPMRVIKTDYYIHRLGYIIRAHYLTALSTPEIEIAPNKIDSETLRTYLPEAKYLLAHISSGNNPEVANETFALMRDAEDSGKPIAVIGMDVGNMDNFASATKAVLAHAQLPGQDRRRLISFELNQFLLFDALWRDETCMTIETDQVLVNPTEASKDAKMKTETLQILKHAGFNVPEWEFLSHEKGGITEEINDKIREFIIRIRKGDQSTARVYLSSNTGTQSQYTGTVEVDYDNIGPAIETIRQKARMILQTKQDVILTSEVGNLEYRPHVGADSVVVDLRYNVTDAGSGSIGVGSAYATVATDPKADTAAVSKGGVFVDLADVYNNVVISERSGSEWQGVRIPLTQDDVIQIHKEALRALQAFNVARDEKDALKFAGVDVKIEIYDIKTHDEQGLPMLSHKIKVWIHEINAEASGLSHSNVPALPDDTQIIPQVAHPSFWKGLITQIEANAAAPTPAQAPEQADDASEEGGDKSDKSSSAGSLTNEQIEQIYGFPGTNDIRNNRLDIDRLSLDLSHTGVTDISALSDMP
ncbi:hypothetical protein ACFL0T_08590, partial [Candidatus Omnitrophota bacterium]